MSGHRQNPEPRTQNQPGAERGYTYRALIVWQKAQALTLAVIQMVGQLPNTRVAQIISDQIVRSASSIGANIAEGHGRYSPAAHANYLSIAKASACETDNFLDLLRRAGYLTPDAEARLHSDCTEVIRMLTAKILNLQRMQKTRGSTAMLGEEVVIYGMPEYTAEDPVLGSGS